MNGLQWLILSVVVTGLYPGNTLSGSKLLKISLHVILVLIPGSSPHGCSAELHPAVLHVDYTPGSLIQDGQSPFQRPSLFYEEQNNPKT